VTISLFKKDNVYNIAGNFALKFEKQMSIAYCVTSRDIKHFNRSRLLDYAAVHSGEFYRWTFLILDGNESRSQGCHHSILSGWEEEVLPS